MRFAAFYGVVQRFHEEKNRPEKIEKAIAVYAKLASQLHAPSLHNLGVLHENGRGVDANAERALDFYQISARQKFDESYLYAAEILVRGAANFQGKAYKTRVTEAFCYLTELVETYNKHPNLERAYALLSQIHDDPLAKEYDPERAEMLRDQSEARGGS